MLRPLLAAGLLLAVGPLAAQPRLAPTAPHVDVDERWAAAEASRQVTEARTDEARRRAAALAIPGWYAASGARITVNTVAGDNDGTCGTDPADAEQDCSLLEAFDLANADPGADVIAFDPAVFGGGATIAPDATPVITTRVTIDGTTDGLAAGDVAIDGPDGTFDYALQVSGADASDSVVRGLGLVRSPSGLAVSGADRVWVTGCFVGTNAAGEDLGNTQAGIAISDATGTVVGGTAPGAANTVGFNREGIDLFGQASFESVGTQIVGNFVGTNAAGGDLGNETGIRVFGLEASNIRDTVIGGMAPGAPNTVGFGVSGIFLLQATSTRVMGNFVGTNAAGADLGGMRVGIEAIAGVDTVIGGTVPEAANTVGFWETGISLIDEIQGRVEGNFIGTNAAGQDLDNQSGILALGSGDTAIGGAAPGAANTVGFNTTGLLLGAASVRVEGNRIGTNAAGDDLGNEVGILLFGADPEQSMRIGGVTPEAANSLTSNGVGILISDGAMNLAVLGNAISGNDALGIDIAPGYVADGVTPNDAGDGDDGPNGVQNYPVVTSVAPGGPVGVSLDSTPGTAFRIEAFASDAVDASGHGEGARFLGAVDVTTDASGAATGAVPTTALVGGEWVTTTATPLGDTDGEFGGTSEFSEAVYLARVATLDGPDAGLVVAAYPNPASDRVTVVLSGAAPGPVRVALHDALGREVAVLYDGPATGDVRAEVDGRRLAPGTYQVRVEGADGIARVPVTVVR